MKNLKLLSAVMIFFTAFQFTSCSSDVEPIDPAIIIPDPSDPENPNNPNNPTPGTFKVDFDGQTYVATTTQAIVNDNYIAITAIRGANAELFQITIPNGEVGTYSWSALPPGGSPIALAYNANNGGSAFVSVPPDGEFSGFPSYVDTATITISSINTSTNIISGTFKFTGVRFADDTGETIETKVFTNGVFELPYNADTPPGPTGNAFTAKLNGTVFTPTNIMAVSSSGLIQIIGRRGAVENISINVPATITPGTYELSMFGDYVGLYIADASPTGTFSADSGTVTISVHDTANDRIKGTFNFIATSFLGSGSHTISDGTFDVEY